MTSKAPAELAQYFGTSPAAQFLEAMYDDNIRSVGWPLVIGTGAHAEASFTVAASIGFSVMADFYAEESLTHTKGDYAACARAIGKALLDEMILSRFLAENPKAVKKIDSTITLANASGANNSRTQRLYHRRTLLLNELRSSAAAVSPPAVTDHELHAAGMLVLYSITQTCPEVEVVTRKVGKGRMARFIRLSPAFLFRTDNYRSDLVDGHGAFHPEPFSVEPGSYRVKAASGSLKEYPLTRRGVNLTPGSGMDPRGEQCARDAINYLSESKRSLTILEDAGKSAFYDAITKGAPDHPGPMPKAGAPKHEWRQWFQADIAYERYSRRTMAARRAVRFMRRFDKSSSVGYQAFNTDYRGRIYVASGPNWQANKTIRNLMVSEQACFEARGWEFIAGHSKLTGVHFDTIDALFSWASREPRDLLGDVLAAAAADKELDSSQAMAAALRLHASLRDGRTKAAHNGSVETDIPMFYDYKCSALQIISVLTADANLGYRSGLLIHPRGSVDDAYTYLGKLIGINREGAKSAVTLLLFGAKRANIEKDIAKSLIQCGRVKGGIHERWPVAVKRAKGCLVSMLDAISMAFPGLYTFLHFKDAIRQAKPNDGGRLLYAHAHPTGYHGFTTAYIRRPSKLVNSFTHGKRRFRVSVTDPTSDRPTDVGKILGAILPNIIHRCDSGILYRALGNLQERGHRGAVFPVHDSIGGGSHVRYAMRDAMIAFAADCWGTGYRTCWDFDAGQYGASLGVVGDKLPPAQFGPIVELD